MFDIIVKIDAALITFKVTLYFPKTKNSFEPIALYFQEGGEKSNIHK